MYSRRAYFLVPFLFLVIYFQALVANYAYLDEVYQLWHNNDDTNFIVCHVQGRWLTGLIAKKLFSSISTIDQLKLLRVFSLVGWVLTAFACSLFLRKWTQSLKLSVHTWWVSSIAAMCSISVCICIGFASCFEVFAGVLFGLLSGHILFNDLYKQAKEIHLPSSKILMCLICGLVSLFIYQPGFGTFLIPFFLCYVQGRKAKPSRMVVIGIVFYFIIYVIYYFLFKYSLTAYHLAASTRTEIHFNFLKKLSFFFSGPFPQGFSMNLLFSASSVFSQIFYPIVFVVWLIITFKRNSANTFIENSIFVGVVLLLLAMIYFPNMIAAESFPSYRTLFAFNLAVFIMVIDSLIVVLKTEKSRQVFTIAASIWLILTAVYAFNFQFIKPLKKEYAILRRFFDARYKPGIDSIYFIRADKFLFSREFGTRVYRDEFGAPSTYRDWVPEPIVKQMIFELTRSRITAEQTNVTQFDNQNAFDTAGLVMDSSKLIINMNLLFKE